MKASTQGGKVAEYVVIFEAKTQELEEVVLGELRKLVAPPEIPTGDAQWLSNIGQILNYGSKKFGGLAQFKAEGARGVRPVLDMVVERDSQKTRYVGVRIHIVDRGTLELSGRLAWDDRGIHSFLQGAVDALKIKVEDRFGYVPKISVDMVYRQQS